MNLYESAITKEQKTVPNSKTKNHGNKNIRQNGSPARTNSTSKCLPIPSSTSAEIIFREMSDGRLKIFIKSIYPSSLNNPISAKN